LQLDLFSFQPKREKEGQTFVLPAPGSISTYLSRRPIEPPPAPESPSQPSAQPKTAAAAEGIPATKPAPSATWEAPRNTRNYRITEADKIGSGSLKTKCHANLAALELLKWLKAEMRPASAEEQRVLVRYAGWGALSGVFDGSKAEWHEARERLETLLTPEEMESVRATTLNAHYTTPRIIGAIYAILEHLGFEGGRILEPACGIGHFLGLIPESMSRRSQITAIEIDPVSASIARALYPDADVRAEPFEKSKLPDGYFDAALSNIPFGDYRPFDPKFKAWKFRIHDYFFAAALAKLRPGGLLVFVTSRGTLDKQDKAAREFIAREADFLGAIRLPNTTFQRNAHTQVTTDIVILRKRLPGEAPAGIPFREIVPLQNSAGETILVNEYFAARPEMMLGEMRLSGSLYQGSEPTLEGKEEALETELPKAIARLPENIFQNSPAPPPAKMDVALAPEVKPNAYALAHGRIMVREGDSLVPVEGLSGPAAGRIRGLIGLREAVRECLRSQLEEANDKTIQEAREHLNLVYDCFVARFGAVSEAANQKAFQGDPDLPLLLSLERFDPDTRKAEKAAIFRERTLQQEAPAPNVAGPNDALLLTLNAKGRVDLPHLENLLHRPPEEFLPELKGAIFLDPQSGAWETEDAYLSGNVREKLAAAEAAALIDPYYQANLEALRQVQPEALSAEEIDARLGSAWIPAEDIQEFIETLLQEKGARVTHLPELGLWLMQPSWSMGHSLMSVSEWGTDRRNAVELIQDALNLRTPTVHDEDHHSGRPVINAPATEAARDKQEKIKEAFKGWIWEDAFRRKRLVEKYNLEFNSIRLRSFSGDHLTLPGASPAVALRPHQKAAVWRILQTPNCLLAHVVGAGKTYTMVAAAMELRRLGLARKPLFAVPNHMLGQFASELLTLYPGANILAAGKEDFEKGKRELLMSRIATSNWDAVIVTHAGFEKIPVLPETESAFFHRQLSELSLATERWREDENYRTVKILERAKKRLETRLQELAGRERKDHAITFEELGVDRLFVDEAHYFKNLFYVTKMTRVSGLPATASQRALDMFLKVSHLQSRNRGGGVVFATGTPIANSVAEMFTMQRYLQMAALEALSLHHFDSWAATFGEPVTAMELSPDGSGYRLNTRFARFINVPELMRQFRQVADIQTQEMLKLPVPELRNGRPTVVSAPATPELKAIVGKLVERAEALRSRRTDPSIDNMLMVTSDGRKAALDLRLYDGSLPDHPESKVNLAVMHLERIWRETETECGVQLLFCDLSTPGPGFTVYDEIKRKLMARGVSAAEIAFAQDFESDHAKAALFRDVRAGRVRILLGSTAKMGSGTNVQERLVALHHLDAPWRPADVEQREGRILRQGNRNREVEIFRYVTEGSFDAYMWQTLETKARFIAQVMTGESELRRIEDIDGAALTYAEVKAIASGNPLVREKAGVDAELSRLARLQTQHAASMRKLSYERRGWAEEVPRLERRLKAMRADLAKREETRGDRFILILGRETIRERGVAGELLNREAAKLRESEKMLGTFAGFELRAGLSSGHGPVLLLRGQTVHEAKVAASALGTIRSLEHAVQSIEERARELEDSLAAARKRTIELEARSEQPFEYAAQLSALRQRQAELADALDLTSNQASSQSETAPVDQSILDGGTNAMTIKEFGFAEDWEA